MRALSVPRLKRALWNRTYVLRQKLPRLSWYYELRVKLALQRRTPYERRALENARHQDGQKYSCINLNDNPLVSVVIPTYNRGQLLVERTLPSVLSQSYSNFEVIIVGDHSPQETVECIKSLTDTRVHFFNLPRRHPYPKNPLRRWLVAGAPPLNRAMQEAKGEWISHLDDDEVYEPDHIEKLLRFALKNDKEIVYGQTLRQDTPDNWQIVGSLPFGVGLRVKGTVPHSAVLYRSYLRIFSYDANGWRLGIPGDKWRWLRMRHAGVRSGFLEGVITSAPLRPNTKQSESQAEDRE